MDQSKISADLNIAMEVPDSVRENSLDLNVGYDEYFNEWELIIRYTGNLDIIRDELSISIEELLGGYAIVRIPQFLIGTLSEYPQIDYIEKPKSLLLSQMNGVNASCTARVRLPDYNLTGRGTLVACLDSGVDIYHPDFQYADHTTRIVRLWDQTIPGNPPAGFRTGSLYTDEEINIAIRQEEIRNEPEASENRMNEAEANEALMSGIGADRENAVEGVLGDESRSLVLRGRDIVPEFDGTGHGTAVLGIMAGNGRASGGRNMGMAPEAEIVAVKLGNPDEQGFPRTTQLMLAVDYAVRYAIEVGKPIAINISFGNNYGAHNGNAILERYLDTVANMYRTSVVVGSGNEGVTARHASGTLIPRSEEVVEIYVGDYLRSFNLQIWKHFQDDFDVYVETPFGRRIGPLSELSDVQLFTVAGNAIASYYGEPTPYNPEQEIYISFSAAANPNMAGGAAGMGGSGTVASAAGSYITPGVWKIYLQSRGVASGRYDMWLPVAGSTSAEVSFVRPDILNTLSIPSTARYVISVSAYDSGRDTYAPFSGRGVYLDLGEALNNAKPDLVAPGVAINSTRVGGGYGEFSGTSFAAPFVTGAASLLMQYGIVNGNDRFLYGEKLRASLIRGARPLSVQQYFPSPLLGWGALCVADSVRG